MWRWIVSEVYDRSGTLETDGHGLDGITWGPRIPEPTEPEQLALIAEEPSQ
jgi:hypothetical protein